MQWALRNTTLVNEHPVVPLAVITQRLAVIACHHDNCAIPVVSRRSRASSSRPTCESANAISPMTRITEGRAKGFGRIRRACARLRVETDTRRNASRPRRLATAGPRQRSRSRARRSGRGRDRYRQQCPVGNAAVLFEALRQTAVRVEHGPSDERPGSKPARVQNLGERRVFRRERRIGVVVNTMRRGKQAREQAAMRG